MTRHALSCPLSLAWACGLALLAFGPATATALQSADPHPAAARANLEDGQLALQGYDPVAYFSEGGGRPLEGRKDLTAEFRGATYRFADAAHRRLFLARPERFEPTYGGWCAYAMADGDKVEIDPESFLIQTAAEGAPERLYLFYDSFFADTRKRWLKQPDALRVKADAAWSHLAPTPASPDLSAWNLGPDGLALGGADPVALRDGTLTPGLDTLTTRFGGVLYRFGDEAHQLRFLADPERYVPALGGWDPVALAEGRRLPGVPEHAAVLDGRLVLFAAADDAAAGQVARRRTALAEAERKWQALAETPPR